MYLQGRSTVPSMSPKTDGRLSTMTTQDEAGNIRAFPLGPRLQRSGARKKKTLSDCLSRTDSTKGQRKVWTAISVISYSFPFWFSEKERQRVSDRESVYFPRNFKKSMARTYSVVFFFFSVTSWHARIIDINIRRRFCTMETPCKPCALAHGLSFFSRDGDISDRIQCSWWFESRVDRWSLRG